MAGPKLDEGYARIANQIFEEVATQKLNGIQFRILLIVWRQTYGFSRKSAELSVTFLATAIKSDARGVKKELKKLLDGNVLKVFHETKGNRGRMIGFNKYAEHWFAGDNSPPQDEKPCGVELPPSEGDDYTPLVGDDSPPKKERKKTIKKEDIDMKIPEEKQAYADTVFLTPEQYEKLCTDFGTTKVNDTIEALDEWQTNKKPSQHKKDHNKTLRVWIKRDMAKAPVKNKQQKREEENAILNQFYEEGAAREANGNSQLPGSNQDSLSLL
ncbi:hypothetical protein B2I21_08540 [Chryseobacterium mucoviscidosis]|nr:hypothetical protein B2I21_08540 [Chryseobacterium mucoviscidosis]